MAVQADDLKVGMFVAITGLVKNDEEPDYLEAEHFTYQTMNVRRKERRHRFDGVPLEILAISYPFVCVTNQGVRFGMDLRDVILTKLNKDFVEEMAHGAGLSDGGRYTGERKVPASVRRKMKKDKRKLEIEARQNKVMCPRCFNPKTTQLRKEGGKWFRHCERCGLDRPMDDEGPGSAVEE